MIALPLFNNAALMLLALVIGHALCEYPLQGDYLAKNKNRHINTSGGWWLDMLAHCLIQSGMVWLITGMWELGLA